MFKNRSVQMKLVNDKKVYNVPEKTTVNVINTPKVKHVAVALGSLYAVKTAVDTASKIALHIATK